MAAGGGICKVLSDSKGNLLVEFNNVTVLGKVSGIYQITCTIVHSLWPNFTKNENERILHFNNFSNAYTCTCTYVVMKVSTDSNQNWIF